MGIQPSTSSHQENQKDIKGGSRNKSLLSSFTVLIDFQLFGVLSFILEEVYWPSQVRNIRGSEQMGDGCGDDSEITTEEERKSDTVAVTVTELRDFQNGKS
ncbi:hypothetical protein Bca4012_083504 [Brassica carinata]